MSEAISTSQPARRLTSAKPSSTAPEIVAIPACAAMCKRLIAIVSNDKSRDLSIRQLTVLILTATNTDSESRTVRGLAKRCGTHKPAITRAADTLARIGYLKRRPHADDKRLVVLEITAAGMRFVRALEAV